VAAGGEVCRSAASTASPTRRSGGGSGVTMSPARSGSGSRSTGCSGSWPGPPTSTRTAARGASPSTTTWPPAARSACMRWSTTRTRSCWPGRPRPSPSRRRRSASSRASTCYGSPAGRGTRSTTARSRWRCMWTGPCGPRRWRTAAGPTLTSSGSGRMPSPCRTPSRLASRWTCTRSGSGRTAPAPASRPCCRARRAAPRPGTWPPACSIRSPRTRPVRSTSSSSPSTCQLRPRSTPCSPVTRCPASRRPRRWPAAAARPSRSTPTTGTRT
jgi:hypothetical protein